MQAPGMPGRPAPTPDTALANAAKASRPPPPHSRRQRRQRRRRLGQALATERRARGVIARGRREARLLRGAPTDLSRGVDPGA
eukprot:336550-Chlamydomonas_euryale.AAC.1